MKTVSLNRWPVELGGEYQSVMMTPPYGSADISGSVASVSSAPRHKKALTPTPYPPASAADRSAGNVKITPLSGPPIRLNDGSPGPCGMIPGAVGLGCVHEHP